MPTFNGPFGHNEVAEKLHRELLDKFTEALENEGVDITPEIRQKIMMVFLNEATPEWIQRRIVTAGLEHKTARAMTLGVMREWLKDPRLASLFKAYGKKDQWEMR